MTKKLCAALLAALLLLGTAAVAGDDIVARQFMLLDKVSEDVYLFRGERLLSRVAAGMRLIDGDFIITGPEALAFFQADADRFFQLGPDGSVVITKMDASSLAMTVKEGELLFNIVSPLGQGETLEIEAGNTTMSIRGTSGRFVYSKHKTTQTSSLEVYSGLVNVSVSGLVYAVEAGSSLVVVSSGDSFTATRGKNSAGLPPDFAERVSLAGLYGRIGQPMPTTKPVYTPEAILPTATPKSTAQASAPTGQQSAGVACPNCGRRGLATAEAHRCATCGGWTCYAPSQHGPGICNAYTCLNCGKTGLASPGAHICWVCDRWLCYDAFNHGVGICNVDPTIRCPSCLATVAHAGAHKCEYCGGYTCQLGAHGIDACVFPCQSCGELLTTKDAHKCTYPGCDGYICDLNHQ